MTTRSGWIEDRKGRKRKDGTPVGGNRWRARYRTPDGGKRSKTFATKIEAQRWLDGQKVAQDRGEWVDPNEGKVLFSDYAAEVQASRVHLAATTKARDEGYMRTLVLPHLGELRLSSIRPTNLRRMVATLTADGYAPATVRKAYQLAAMVLSRAVLDDKLARTPARGVDLPSTRGGGDSKQSKIREPLTHHEAARLHEAIDPRYRVAVLLGAYAGLRAGEVFGLQVENLDLLRRRLRVAATLTNLSGAVSLGPPKTEASRRTISISQALVDELAAHLAEYGPGPEGVVLSSPHGSWVRASSWRQRFWNPAVEAAGLQRPLRFHDLRHTHASWLIAEGAHAKAIQGRLGHSSIVVTMDTYGHLMPEIDEGLADVLDARMQDARLSADTYAVGRT